MSAYYQLPPGITVYEPGTATFSGVSHRLGAGNRADGSFLMRYDQRHFGFAVLYLGILALYLILLYLFPTSGGIGDYNGYMPVLLIGIFCMPPLILLYYSFILACGVHWILCSPDGIYMLRYSLFSVGRRALFIPKKCVTGIVWDMTCGKTVTFYHLKAGIGGRRKRSLVYLDSSHERVLCLYAILKRRYAPNDDGIMHLDDPGF